MGLDGGSKEMLSARKKSLASPEGERKRGGGVAEGRVKGRGDIASPSCKKSPFRFPGSGGKEKGKLGAITAINGKENEKEGGNVSLSREGQRSLFERMGGKGERRNKRGGKRNQLPSSQEGVEGKMF